jgi:uncharacterized coiled-coil DUF342 family protein
MREGSLIIGELSSYKHERKHMNDVEIKTLVSITKELVHAQVREAMTRTTVDKLKEETKRLLAAQPENPALCEWEKDILKMISLSDSYDECMIAPYDWLADFFKFSRAKDTDRVLYEGGLK